MNNKIGSAKSATPSNALEPEARGELQGNMTNGKTPNNDQPMSEGKCQYLLPLYIDPTLPIQALTNRVDADSTMIYYHQMLAVYDQDAYMVETFNDWLSWKRVIKEVTAEARNNQTKILLPIDLFLTTNIIKLRPCGYRVARVVEFTKSLDRILSVSYVICGFIIIHECIAANNIKADMSSNVIIAQYARDIKTILETDPILKSHGQKRLGLGISTVVDDVIKVKTLKLTDGATIDEGSIDGQLIGIRQLTPESVSVSSEHLEKMRCEIEKKVKSYSSDSQREAAMIETPIEMIGRESRKGTNSIRRVVADTISRYGEEPGCDFGGKLQSFMEWASKPGRINQTDAELQAGLVEIFKYAEKNDITEKTQDSISNNNLTNKRTKTKPDTTESQHPYNTRPLTREIQVGQTGQRHERLKRASTSIQSLISYLSSLRSKLQRSMTVTSTGLVAQLPTIAASCKYPVFIKTNLLFLQLDCSFKRLLKSICNAKIKKFSDFSTSKQSYYNNVKNQVSRFVEKYHGMWESALSDSNRALTTAGTANPVQGALEKLSRFILVVDSHFENEAQLERSLNTVRLNIKSIHSYLIHEKRTLKTSIPASHVQQISDAFYCLARVHTSLKNEYGNDALFFRHKSGHPSLALGAAQAKNNDKYLSIVTFHLISSNRLYGDALLLYTLIKLYHPKVQKSSLWVFRSLLLGLPWITPAIDANDARTPAHSRSDLFLREYNTPSNYVCCGEVVCGGCAHMVCAENRLLHGESVSFSDRVSSMLSCLRSVLFLAVAFFNPLYIGSAQNINSTARNIRRIINHQQHALNGNILTEVGPDMVTEAGTTQLSPLMNTGNISFSPVNESLITVSVLAISYMYIGLHHFFLQHIGKIQTSEEKGGFTSPNYTTRPEWYHLKQPIWLNQGLPNMHNDAVVNKLLWIMTSTSGIYKTTDRTCRSLSSAEDHQITKRQSATTETPTQATGKTPDLHASQSSKLAQEQLNVSSTSKTQQKNCTVIEAIDLSKLNMNSIYYYYYLVLNTLSILFTVEDRNLAIGHFKTMLPTDSLDQDTDQSIFRSVPTIDIFRAISLYKPELPQFLQEICSNRKCKVSGWEISCIDLLHFESVMKMDLSFIITSFYLRFGDTKNASISLTPTSCGLPTYDFGNGMPFANSLVTFGKASLLLYPVILANNYRSMTPLLKLWFPGYLLADEYHLNPSTYAEMKATAMSIKTRHQRHNEEIADLYSPAVPAKINDIPSRTLRIAVNREISFNSVSWLQWDRRIPTNLTLKDTKQYISRLFSPENYRTQYQSLQEDVESDFPSVSLEVILGKLNPWLLGSPSMAMLRELSVPGYGGQMLMETFELTSVPESLDFLNTLSYSQFLNKVLDGVGSYSSLRPINIVKVDSESWKKRRNWLMKLYRNRPRSIPFVIFATYPSWTSQIRNNLPIPVRVDYDFTTWAHYSPILVTSEHRLIPRAQFSVAIIPSEATFDAAQSQFDEYTDVMSSIQSAHASMVTDEAELRWSVLKSLRETIPSVYAKKLGIDI